MNMPRKHPSQYPSISYQEGSPVVSGSVQISKRLKGKRAPLLRYISTPCKTLAPPPLEFSVKPNIRPTLVQ
jgi:hypothetical protein